MNSLTLYIIIAIAGMTVVVPVLAADRLKPGDYVSTEGTTKEAKELK